MQHQVVIPLPVPAAQAWEVLADLRAWPSWTPTVQALDSSSPHPAIGAAVTIKQPGRTPAHYVIDLVEEGRRFRWGSHRAGVRQQADHLVDTAPRDTCTVTLTFAMSGPVGGVLGALGAKKIRTMLQTEADALQATIVDH